MERSLAWVLLRLWIWTVPILPAAPGEVRQIAQGVWFREGEFRESDHCNNIWIEMKDYVILVDANWPGGALACQEDLRKTTGKPLRYVLITHHHEDHLYGSPIWTRNGAISVAHRGVIEEMKRYEPKRWQDAVASRRDVAQLGINGPEPPARTFAGEKFVLDDGTRRVEFLHFGWAHTRGDGFVYLPRERILCTGDAVVHGPYNYLGDSNGDNWPRVIERLLKLDVATVLPGHGLPGGQEVLVGQRNFLLELRAAVASAVKAGRKLDDLIVLKGKQPIATTIKLPDSVQKWVTGDLWNPTLGLAVQVEMVFRELTEGKPHGEILGGK